MISGHTFFFPSGFVNGAISTNVSRVYRAAEIHAYIFHTSRSQAGLTRYLQGEGFVFCTGGAVVSGSGWLTKLLAGSGFDLRQNSSQKLTLNPRTLSILANKKLANYLGF